MKNPYIHESMLAHIDKSCIETIFEIGCRDGLYTQPLWDIYKPKVLYSFEANPQLQKTIEENQKKLGDKVVHTNIGLWSTERELVFYLHPDGGSSSFYKHPRDRTEAIVVGATTLDLFCEKHAVEKIDLICIDVEGAEPAIFTNQKILNTVTYIIAEVAFDPMWKKGCPHIEHLEGSLAPYGFEMVNTLLNPTKQFGDTLWVKKGNEQKL
tara:strand:+ start:1881 stop:2510 length:630 start_codon:yes stop_codon:yes gene_type:complete